MNVLREAHRSAEALQNARTEQDLNAKVERINELLEHARSLMNK